MDADWRIIVLGDAGVGKKRINKQFVQGQTPETCNSRFEDGVHRPAIVDNEKCFITTEDINSSLYESPEGDQSIRQCDGAILLYDIASKESFSHVQGYCDRLRTLTSSHIPMYLVGNKLDTADKRKVETSEGKLLAEAFDPRCPFTEVSAKTADNVEHVYFNLVREIRRQHQESDEKKHLGKRKTNLSLRRPVSTTGSTAGSTKKKGIVASFKQVFRQPKE